MAQQSGKKRWRRLLRTLLGTVVALVLVRALVLTPCRIASTDMEPALGRGTRVLVNRWSYGLRLPLGRWLGYHRWASSVPRVGDVVVYNHPADLAHPVELRPTCIGRCMGLPGDTVLTADGLVVVVPGLTCSVEVTPSNVHLLQRTLALHEGKRAEVRGGGPAPGMSQPNNVQLGTLQSEATQSDFAPLDDTQSGYPQSGALQSGAPQLDGLLTPGASQSGALQPADSLPSPTLWVDGKPLQRVTFSQDYYWVTADSPDSLTGSPSFGFVPHSHLVGRALTMGR